jgi:mycothiol synthase
MNETTPESADHATRADVAAELLPSDLGLTWRPLSVADTEPLHELIQSIEAADKQPYRTSLAEVGDIFEGDWKNTATDTIVGIDADGRFRAYACLESRPGDESTQRVFVMGGVHPLVRDVGIGRALVAWMTARAKAILEASPKRIPGRIAAYLEDTSPTHFELYEAAGYAVNRFYSNLRRDLRDPIPPVSIDPELRLVPWSAEIDDLVRLAHNDAFRDHWGSEPATPESWAQGHSMFAPEWSFVVLDDNRMADGVPYVAGYLISGRYERDWPIAGYSSGYIETLGVRREYRGRKLAISLLSAAMEVYRASGIEYAELDVDTDNPSGTFGLYSSLGFTKVQGSRMYSIEIEQVGVPFKLP